MAPYCSGLHSEAQIPLGIKQTKSNKLVELLAAMPLVNKSEAEGRLLAGLSVHSLEKRGCSDKGGWESPEFSQLHSEKQIF